MSEVRVDSTELLLALEASLGAGAQAIQESISAARSRAASLTERLSAQRSLCRQQIEHWRGCIANADEEEDTTSYYEQKALWEQRLEDTERSIARMDGACNEFRRVSAELTNLAQDRTPRARAFLRRRAGEIENYESLKAEGGTVHPSASTLTSSAAAVPSPVWFTGYRRTKHDPRDWLWSKLYGPTPNSLPGSCILESLVGPAYDQKDTPQCVCCSLAALKHHDEYRKSQTWLLFDPEPIYRQCKARDGAVGEDGTTIRDGFKVAVKSGLVAGDGQRYFIKAYARLENADEICHALSLQKLVLIGLRVDGTQLSQLERQALVVAPDHTDGAHCMVIVGYDAGQRIFRVRNSWGSHWGDIGHCWIPFSYLAIDPDFDAWTSVCDKVSAKVSHCNEAPRFPDREVFPNSNFAWFNPSDVSLSDEDGRALDWKRITPEDAQESLRIVTRMRAYLDLSQLRSGTASTTRDYLARLTDDSRCRIFTEDDLRVFDLYFRSEAIRIDSDGQGGFMVVNGRHRLHQAQKLGITSVPVSISNLARKQLADRIALGQ
jgi:hypothetical protein